MHAHAHAHLAAMIQLVETTEESSFLLVADHVATLLNGEGEATPDSPGTKLLEACAALLTEENYEGFLALVMPHLGAVFASCSDKDCECVSAILVNAIVLVPAASTAVCACALAAALCDKVDERADERLGALLNLYAITTRPEVQLPVLMAAATYAARSPRTATLMTGVVTSSGMHTETWGKAMGLSDAQARDLFLALAELVKASERRGADKEHLRLIINALKLVPEGDAAALALLKPHAVTAIADYMKNPLLFQSDLGELPAVRQLSSDAATAPLYKLMTTMLGGDLAAYKAAATPAALQLSGMTEEAALHKARMAALLALGNRAAAGHDEVTFAEIQTALDITEDQVELFVVKAIGAKLLEGKIDQIRGAVSITRCSMRTFGPTEWATIKTRLSTWREALVSVQQNLAANKAGAASAGVPSRGAQAINV
jgi:translation initiation factor 3 subunit M